MSLFALSEQNKNKLETGGEEEEGGFLRTLNLQHPHATFALSETIITYTVRLGYTS